MSSRGPRKRPINHKQVGYRRKTEAEREAMCTTDGRGEPPDTRFNNNFLTHTVRPRTHDERHAARIALIAQRSGPRGKVIRYRGVAGTDYGYAYEDGEG